MINEESIRREVYSRPVTLDVDTEWETPSGNLRKSPIYVAWVSNDFLDLSREVKAKTTEELEQKAQKQLSAWAEREIKTRVSNAKKEVSAEREAKVDELNEDLARFAREVETLLEATLGVDDFVDLESLKRPSESLRTKISVLEKELPPPPRFIPAEKVQGWFRRRKRQEEADEAAKAHHATQATAWQDAINDTLDRQGAYPLTHSEAESTRVSLLEKKRQQLQVDVIEFNESLDRLATNLAYGVPEAVAEYVGIVLDRSDYPDALDVCHECEFDPAASELKVQVLIASPGELDSAREYKYRKAANEIVSVDLTKKAQKDRYTSIVEQVALRTLHEIFEADRKGLIRSIALTLGSSAVDPATGNRAVRLFVAVSVDREAFLEINLGAVVPAATLKHLGAAVSKDPYGLVEVDSRGIRKS